MRILFLSDDFPPDSAGGASIVAYRLAKGLSQLGNEVHVVTTTRNRNRCGQEIRQGLTVHSVYSNYPLRYRSYRSLYNPQVVSKVRAIIREVRPDIVHAHNVHMYLTFYSLKVARDLKIPCVLTTHDYMLFCATKFTCSNGRTDYKPSLLDCIRCQGCYYFPLRNLIIKQYVNKYVQKIVTVSKAVEAALSYNGFNNIETIYNGINPVAFPSGSEQLKDEYGIRGRKVIFHSGRLSYHKGSGQLVKAMPYILDKIDAVLLLAGTRNSFTDYLETLSAELGVQDNVFLLGWQDEDDMMKIYHMCDVCVTPSLYSDPFPTTNMEAMAMKKPVVGTCFGGTPEIVVDGKTGYIVNPLNEAQLAERITDILTDEPKAKDMGNKGYEQVLAKFTVDIQVKETMRLYEEIRIAK
ncbi:glycosyltransferase family 4 protein [Chloroflexota bacterium]